MGFPSGCGITARPPRPSGPSWRRCRRRPEAGDDGATSRDGATAPVGAGFLSGVARKNCFHVLKQICFTNCFTLVGFKGNLSPLEICFFADTLSKWRTATFPSYNFGAVLPETWTRNLSPLVPGGFPLGVFYIIFGCVVERVAFW